MFDRSFLLAVGCSLLLAGQQSLSVQAFVLPNSSTPFIGKATTSTSNNFVLFSDVTPNHMDSERNSAEEAVSIELGEMVRPLELAGKFATVLMVKTAKDIVQYPPQFLEEALNADRTLEVVMLFKFLGVLAFKVVHDAVYFPMAWTQKHVFHKCQSSPHSAFDEECEL